MTAGRSITIGGFTASSISSIWRVPGSEEAQGVGVFARFIGAPADRNLVDFYFDGGVTFTGMFRKRPNDALAVGFAYTNISDQVSAYDVDFGEPVARNYESLVEICYTFKSMTAGRYSRISSTFGSPAATSTAKRTQRLWGHAPP